jgi:hypothetical protein
LKVLMLLYYQTSQKQYQTASSSSATDDIQVERLRLPWAARHRFQNLWDSPQENGSRLLLAFAKNQASA